MKTTKDFYRKEKFSFDKMEEGKRYFASISGELGLVNWERRGDMDERMVVIDTEGDEIFDYEVDFILVPVELNWEDSCKDLSDDVKVWRVKFD